MPQSAIPQRRFIPSPRSRIELSQRADAESPQIIGYASVFYDGTPATEYQLWEGMVERIMPGAFDRAIREDDVRALFNHSPDYLLGRTTSQTLALSVDAKGLRYEIDPPATTCGQDVLTSIRRQDLTGSSFAFLPRRTVWIEQDELLIREIHEVELFDVGPVTYPAYEASTTGIRDQGPGTREEARAEFEAWKQTQQPPIAARLAGYRARATEIDD